MIEDLHKEEREFMYTKRCCFNCCNSFYYNIDKCIVVCGYDESMPRKFISAATPACERWEISTNVPQGFNWAKSITDPTRKEPVQLELFEQ